MRRFQVLAVVIALWGAGAAAQETTAVPLDQAGQIAAQALLAGEVELALQIAEAVLAQLPDDRDALIVVAAAAPRVGDPARGRSAGTQAWRVSETDAQKYEAARLTALAAANEERFTLSTFWLRRALTVAPNEEQRAQTIRDARSVTRRNPWSTRLSFSLVPSNNVNGGADSDDCTDAGIFNCSLSEDAVALAGWRASLGFSAQYRLQEAQDSRTFVGLQYQTTRVRITDDVDVPDEAFTTSNYTLSLRHDRALTNGTLGLNASRGRFEYRSLISSTNTTEAEEYDIWRLGIDRRIPINDRTLLSGSLGREWLEYSVSGIGEVDRRRASIGLTYALDSRDRLSGSIAVSDSVGETNKNYTSQDITISATYSWAEPIGPISLSLGGGLRWNEFPEYRIGFTPADKRNDRTMFVNANIGFPRVSYAGFTPSLRIDASQTESDVSRFDRTTLSAGFTISSQF
ncbi:surface lipoprotein assembly modifier [Roseobacter sp. CCS2]|uniref:surface lipoprotein assembly modifier n=1 Tax=Roseobacter sp. CCS2 TaxID=391593 RepID=UPI0000F3E41A|nr:surface lipoprotein assembly modifier [Roseobacter sp. CCS2]EBA12684.1 hypothetical protein RCCS2_15344 [Roseobacter sp. CCS2]